MAWRTIFSQEWLVAGGAVAQQFQQRASFVSPAVPSIVGKHQQNNGGPYRHVLHYVAGLKIPTTALWAKKPKANKAVKEKCCAASSSPPSLPQTMDLPQMSTEQFES
eukprot:scaffold152479_cov27-Attheya_sp.AAC.1